MKSLTVQFRELQKRYDDICEEAGKRQGAIWRLEGEVKALKARAEQSEAQYANSVDAAGKLAGYQQRVREEDAKTLGKLWYESFEKDVFGNTVLR